MNQMIEKQRFSPGMQFAVLLLAFGVCYIIAGIVTVAVSTTYLHKPLSAIIENPKIIEQDAGLNRILQIIGTLLMFGLPAVVFAFVVDKRQGFKVLGFNKIVSGKQILYTLLITIACLWVSEALGIVNQLIPIPASNAAYFKQLEAEYTQMAVSLVSLKDFSGFLLSLFVIAFLPAVLEELIFRGCLQRVMYGLSKHTFLSIFITSLAFSAIHMSYYGFLPRLFLGMVLGYMFHYSKNIWLNIGFHLINNGVAIALMYIAVQQGKTMEQAVNASGVTNGIPQTVVLIGGVVLLAAVNYLITLFKKESARVLAAHPVPVEDTFTIGDDTNNAL